MDVQTTGELIRWIVNGITILLMIAAASLAIKKNNNICLGVAIVGNLAVYYFTLSPLLCMIVSIACIIWASRLTGSGSNQRDQINAPAPVQNDGLMFSISLVTFKTSKRLDVI